ncbi:hypothetical protein ACFL0M_10770 [Thermodesulfobacteriota bacterium]
MNLFSLRKPTLTSCFKISLSKSYCELEKRLEDPGNLSFHESGKQGNANRKHISTTDPDTSVVRMGTGRSKLRYKNHRAVDEKAEVITATEVTAGEMNEALRLTKLIDQHWHRHQECFYFCLPVENRFCTIIGMC